MAALTTLKELRNMALEDLRKEITQQESTVVKLRLGVQLGKEKDSAKYVREKKQLARMKTVASVKRIEASQKTEENTSDTAKSSVPSRSKKS